MTPTPHTQGEEQEHDIKPEAIKAARAGGHLCNECKGYGEMRYHQSWDFSPKEPHGYIWLKCEACGGTGIERNKQLVTSHPTPTQDKTYEEDSN